MNGQFAKEYPGITVNKSGKTMFCNWEFEKASFEIFVIVADNVKINVSKKATTTLEKELKDYVEPLGVDLLKQILQYDRSKRPPASKIISKGVFFISSSSR